MPKIGIITFHRACNYGAFLQSYALQYTIDSLEGVSADLIDYRSKNIEARNSLLFCFTRRGNLLKKLVKCLFDLRDNIIRNRTFEMARRKHFVYGKENISKSELYKIGNCYDAFITGSDQVWNRDIIKDDNSYFLDFVYSPAKKYSYAASIGISELSGADRRYFSNMLADYRMIALRESDMVPDFKALLKDIPVTCTVDPVFLCSAEFWRAFSVYRERKPYVLFFMMGESKSALSAMKTAKNYALHNNMDIIFLSDNERWYKYRDLTHFGAASPEDFVGLIDHAQCVFTNSFHATAMSLILHTPFYVETYVLRSNRISNLLKIAGVKYRGLKSGQYTCQFKDIDWDKVDKNLSLVIKDSKIYLDNIVHDVMKQD